MNHYTVEIAVEVTARDVEEAAAEVEKALEELQRRPWVHGASIYAHLDDEYGRPIEDHEEFV